VTGTCFLHRELSNTVWRLYFLSL